MARVGHALGAKDWHLLGRMIRAVVASAAVLGIFLCAGLWLARMGVLSMLSLNDTAPHGSQNAHAYALALAFFPAAIVRVPPLLLLRAATSILCGYQHVRLASTINVTLAFVDTIAFYIALHVLRLQLPALGYTIALTCTLAAAIALTVVACRPPDPRVQLLCVRPPAPSSVFEDAPQVRPTSLFSLACDSINVLVRSLMLSGSLLSLTVAIAPLGTAALSAHAVILQLWMVTSYFVDGFADAGTMLGSKLLGENTAVSRRQMRWLTVIVALLGLGTGLAVSGALLALRDPIIGAFTRDPEASVALRSPLWLLLCALQPANALVFAYDGLLYATQSFRYVRNALTLGVVFVFAPSLVLAVELRHTLLCVWGAKAGLNLWRCVTALYRIHCQLWPTWAVAPAPAPARPALSSAPLNADRIGTDATDADFVPVD